MGNTGQKKPAPAKIQITVQITLGIRKAPNDSSTSLRHLRAPRARRSAGRGRAGSAGGPSAGMRSATRAGSSPRVRLLYSVFSLSSYSSRARRPSP
jgi:hypothetical protein